MKDLIEIKTGENELHNTIENFLALVGEVPWGNSDWQNRQTIINRELTPERAYRHASIRLMAKLRELQSVYFAIRKENIQIKKLERQLAGEKDELERELIQIDIEKMLSTRSQTKKLIQDAIREVQSLAPVIQSIGKLTREQFEAAEAGHFRLSYHNQATGKNDALTGLEAMGVDLKTGEMTEGFKSLYQEICEKKQIEGGTAAQNSSR